MELSELISLIKKKKELSGVSNSLIKDFLSDYALRRNLQLSSLSEKQARIVMKDARNALRKMAGRFQKRQKERSDLSKSGDYSEILKTHLSTSERLPFYPQIWKILSSIKFSSVLDIGCGLNPLAMAKKGIVYHACDINESELSIIRKYFSDRKISGSVFFQDIRKISQLPYADLCLVFKVLDLVEKKSEVSEKILSLPCRNFMISFPTKTISGRSMSHPERKWFERVLMKIGKKYHKFNLGNEIFYLISS